MTQDSPKFALDIFDIISLICAALGAGIIIGMILEPNLPL